MRKNTIKNALQIILLVSIFFISVPVTDAAKSIPVQKIVANYQVLSLEIGTWKQLSVTVSPSNATNKRVAWSSSNGSVASVSNYGKVKGISPGTAVITAKNQSSGKVASIRVTVRPSSLTPIQVKSILLNKETLLLNPSDAFALVARILPINATDKTLIWSSSNDKVATVDATGYVKATGSGEAVITAMNVASNVKATVPVRVLKVVRSSDEIFDQVNPSIVKIEVYNKHDEMLGTGSGIIVQADGVVLTNFHVIADVTGPVKAKIILDNGNSFYTDKVLGYDQLRDLAVLKINEKVLLPSATFVSNWNTYKAGDPVYALGSPNGVQNVMTSGMIRESEFYFDSKLPYISHSAALYPGNSGGALVNAYGEVIGVNDAVITQGRQSVYLAIPIEAYSQLDLSLPTTIAEVNRKTYVPLAGEGTIYEVEPNDDLDTSTKLPYLKNTIFGKIRDRFDYDGYAIQLTEDAMVNIRFKLADVTYSDYVGIALIDDAGTLIARSRQSFDSDGNSVLQTDAKLDAGHYWIVVTPSNYRINTMRNENYTGTVDFTVLQ